MRILLQRRMIVLLSLLSLVCLVATGWLVSIDIHCHATPVSGSGGIQCGAGTGAANVGPALASVLGFVGFVVLVVVWVVGLMKTARVQSWVWFALVFIVPPVGSLLYGLFGPQTPRGNRQTYIEDMPRDPVTT